MPPHTLVGLSVVTKERLVHAPDACRNAWLVCCWGLTFKTEIRFYILVYRVEGERQLSQWIHYDPSAVKMISWGFWWPWTDSVSTFKA